MGRQLVPGRAVVVDVVDRWVDSWCWAEQSLSSDDRGRQMGRQLVTVPGRAVVVVRHGRQMGRQLVLGRAVVVIVVDRWVDCWCRAGQSSSSR
eukprot:3487778-Rhodomonas_salina.1